MVEFIYNDIQISKESKTPLYKQLMRSVISLINNGVYTSGDSLPSLNVLAEKLDISKETVKKAYIHLCNEGYIEPVQGKAFFISNKEKKTSVLVLFDKISTYKQVLYNSFEANIGETTEVTIRLHNQDIDFFEYILNENLDNFDYYIIAPHFPLEDSIQKRLLENLKRIPSNKLIILDRSVEGLSGGYGCIYQDFEQDVYDGLTQGLETIRTFKKMNIIPTKGSLYAPYIKRGITRFCEDYKINYEIHNKMDSDIINKDEFYLILNGQFGLELIDIAKIARLKSCVIGKDIGLIAYNESPINEIILDGLTVLSTDFEQMGVQCARMITEKNFVKIKSKFDLIRRNTF